MKVARVWYVGAGPGDPELISVLGQRLLCEAQLVVHDTGVAPELLEQCQPIAAIDEARVSRDVSGPELEAIALRVASAARQGKRVVRLKVGDPLFFSRALEEIAVLGREGIEVRVVPGIAAPFGAAAFAGIPLTTNRGLGAAAFVCTLHVKQPAAVQELVQSNASAADCLCVLCDPAQIEAVVHGLLTVPRFAQSGSAIVSRATLPEQVTVEAALERLPDACAARSIEGPLLLVVGNDAAWRPQLAWYEHLPLFGRKLLLCRPEHQARESAHAMRTRGARPLVMPLIQIEPPTDMAPLEQTVGQLSNYDWVILTSANGAEALMRTITTAGLDARAFGRAKIAVIGPGTARPLARWGIVPDLVAQEHVAESLGQELLDMGGAKSALLLRAEVARDVLPDALRKAGLAVTVVAAYSTRKIGHERTAQLCEIIDSQEIDAVLLTSSSMAESLASALGPGASLVLERTCVASIGPITTATLRKLGIRVDLTAEQYTVQGLLDALEQHFAATPAHDSTARTR